jgi:hypothetical protein
MRHPRTGTIWRIEPTTEFDYDYDNDNDHDHEKDTFFPEH